MTIFTVNSNYLLLIKLFTVYNSYLPSMNNYYLPLTNLSNVTQNYLQLMKIFTLNKYN